MLRTLTSLSRSSIPGGWNSLFQPVLEVPSIAKSYTGNEELLAMLGSEPPEGFYDQLLTDRDYCTVAGETVPIRQAIVEEIAAHEGETELTLERPDGTAHPLTGDEPIPSREELCEELLAAQRAFDGEPVRTLRKQFDVPLGPLYYTDRTAHFVVPDNIFETPGESGVGNVPEQFQSVAIRAAHLAEGFRVASALPYSWFEDLGWIVPRSAYMHKLKLDTASPDGDSGETANTQETTDEADEGYELSATPGSCFIVNVPSVFPARAFGAAGEFSTKRAADAIAQTEQYLEQTLLTRRMAQLEALERGCEIAEREVDPNVVAQLTFDISKSGLASLRSQRRRRREEAFETVRLLSDSSAFDLVMDEHAETVDELGQLARLGTKYRQEVLDKPPGFY